MAEGQSDDSEKTEEPTQKRLDDAHGKGDVPKSQEVSTWFMLLGATLIVAIFSSDMARSLATAFMAFLERPHTMAMDGENVRLLSSELGMAVLGAVALPFIMLLVFALAGNLVQHPPILSTEQIKPKFSKVSPVAGWKRLFSSTSLVNFAKGIAKLAIVSTLMFAIAWPQRDSLELMITTDISMLLVLARDMSLKILGGVLAVMTVIAALDLLYQRWKWNQKQRMSMKELRDEYKQMEGDPTIKAKLRQIRMERGRKRMMQNVPQATVVVTNPTHYAVALKYEAGMQAPICVAKGQDQIALTIRRIAEEAGVPLVENPPLARGLHATVEIDREVPEEHYRAVAQVISYVMKLSKGRRRRKAG